MPPLCEDPVAWLQSNLSMPLEVSPNNPGPLSLTAQPWMAEPLRAWLDPAVTHLHLVMGTQTGKTTLLLLGTTLLSLFDPLPLIWALPNDELAEEIVKRRLIPLMRENAALEHLLPLGRISGKNVLPLATMPVYWVGARTPAKMSSRPAAYVIMDEAAKYAHVHRNEAPPYKLLEERTKAFPRRLIVQASTPNVAESEFWHTYKLSDQRHYFVPCPHCGQHQELTFARATVQWQKTDQLTVDHIKRSTRYICQHCGVAIDQEERAGMLARGEWRPTNPAAAPGRRGYHLNSLYSAYVSWGEMAAEFYQATKGAAPAHELQNFANAWQAMPYEYHLQHIREDAVRQLVDASYTRGTLPRLNPCYIVTGYDPGQNRTHWVTVAVYPGGEMYVIDWGTLASYITDMASGVMGPLQHINQQVYGGRRPAFGYIDSGDYTARIYAECARSAGVLRPTKGTAASGGAWGRSMVKGYPLQLLTYADRVAKNDLYGRIIAQRTGELHLPADADEDLVAGLSGQKLREISGKFTWAPVAGDHFGDCIKLARVSWWVHENEFATLNKA